MTTRMVRLGPSRVFGTDSIQASALAENSSRETDPSDNRVRVILGPLEEIRLAQEISRYRKIGQKKSWFSLGECIYEYEKMSSFLDNERSRSDPFDKDTPVSHTETSGRRNKRKSAEPKRLGDVLLLKRFRWIVEDEDEPTTCNEEGERPSSSDSGCHSSDGMQVQSKAEDLQCQPVDLHIKSPTSEKPRNSVIRVPRKIKTEQNCEIVPKNECFLNATAVSDPCENIRTLACSVAQNQDTNTTDSVATSSGSVAGYVDANSQKSLPRSYYKSMSRQRRIEANARERTRVHTISAAFENLRRAVPAYADSQKLSKLAILKIASSYILALACLNEMDYSQEQRKPTLSECVGMCTQTIQSEGKARRRGGNKD